MTKQESNRLVLEVHAIQGFSTNNLNRDDVGSPKDAVFGGVRRARVSSQAWKRAIRTSNAFSDTVRAAGGDVGVRTRGLKNELLKKLEERGTGTTEERDQTVTRVIEKGIGVSLAKRAPKQTEYLLYLGSRDVEQIASYVSDNWPRFDDIEDTQLKKDIQEIIKPKQRALAADVALFGRMFADEKTLNVDAACQVAHSLSTHQLQTDIDYYTAVDDLQEEEESGAGMIGQVEMNGACHYRYLNVDVDRLWRSLGHQQDLIGAVIGGLLKAVAEALPSGKQNSMAAHNPPHYVTVILREDGQRWSLAGAFSLPIRPNGASESVEELSVQKMEKYWKDLVTAYGEPEGLFRRTTHVGDHDGVPYNRLVEETVTHIESRIKSWEQ